MDNIKLHIKDETILTEIDGEAVLLNIDKNAYYGLDEIGLLIWKLLEEGKSYHEVKGEILSRYDVEEQVVTEDLNRFLSDLKEKGLVTW
ncbi:PqqD family protein [Lihuaxuella thermophila]|uniref:Coenzyme PQQ synthesis protein D (PqqD) n=1 Tax=Lihuaxuella thermophila TaxID=1173111 RepID=A0A1H8G7K6_9BACL|nr:PqqD family protein [Lihuaxuella thermophila]SEN39268.1 Coenzyme PQQ synthesis protein D (PqqD) [Lihuaxuella thermophila]